MRGRRGFTLIEMTVAVAVTAFLVTSVSAVTLTLVQGAEGRAGEGRRGLARARAAALLGEEWRARVRILSPDGAGMLRLVTSADGLSSAGRRAAGEVRYTAAPDGLRREEAGGGLELAGEPVVMEFWTGAVWSARSTGAETAIRIRFERPPETVVLR